MLIAGIDLAAEPLGTAVSVIDWHSNKAKLVSLSVNVRDEEIVEIVKDSQKIGIDCAFGWPTAFASFIDKHNNLEGEAFDGGMSSRRELAYRETDRATREIIGRWPLSVSTDRLGLTAMRCAGLLNKLKASGRSINRAGTEDVVEIYPGAALRIWNLETKDYRKSEQARQLLLESICSRASWLDLGDYKAQLVQSCDAFDSLIAALTTRVVVIGGSTKPAENQLKIAEIEGWIYLPTIALEDLL